MTKYINESGKTKQSNNIKKSPVKRVEHGYVQSGLSAKQLILN